MNDHTAPLRGSPQRPRITISSMSSKSTKKKRGAKRPSSPHRSRTGTARRSTNARRPRLVQLEQLIQERTAALTRTIVALRESEERFRTFLDHSPKLAFVKGTDGRYLYVNRRFEETFHIPAGGALGKTDIELFPRAQAEQFQTHDRQVLESGVAKEFEEVAWQADGFHTSIVVKFPLRNASGQIHAIGGVTTDITDRKRTEEALRESHQALRRSQEDLRELAGYLLSAQDDERRRLARDLHDDMNQRLAALALDLEVLGRSLPASLAEARHQLASIQYQVVNISDDVHDLAYQLHPSLLDDVGLEVALQDLVRSFGQREKMSVLFNPQNLPGSIPKPIAGCLYRVTQESLRNVAKHGKASQVVVDLSGSSEGLDLSVKDNGKGFTAERGKRLPHQGLGLISMQERLRLVNGIFTVQSRPGQGTTICAWVPLQEE